KIETAVDQGRRNELWRGEYLKEQQVIMEAVRAEKDNTEAERKRADEAEKRAEDAEARIKELEALLAAK
ncbi:MAG: hypothetical protein IJT37_06570, partial [Lachnospiraceae bacterium]|nr:hypothetical protein [Lachnospiraceae bacterium]